MQKVRVVTANSKVYNNYPFYFRRQQNRMANGLKITRTINIPLVFFNLLIMVR